MTRPWTALLHSRFASSVHYGPEEEIARIVRVLTAPKSDGREPLKAVDGPRPMTEREAMSGAERTRGRVAE